LSGRPRTISRPPVKWTTLSAKYVCRVSSQLLSTMSFAIRRSAELGTAS
jgi:hypothetical protein